MTVILKPTPVTEDAAGYEKLIALVGSSADSLIVMEAAGDYWRNLFVYLCARDFRCAVVNPLRIRRSRRRTSAARRPTGPMRSPSPVRRSEATGAHAFA